MNSVDHYKDLGILFDIDLKTKLKFHRHVSEAAMKANRALACMRRGLILIWMNIYCYIWLYKSVVWPILEYGSIILGSHYVLDQYKLEGVQWCATKLASSLRDGSYINWSTILIAPSLLYTDMIN